MVAVGKQMSQLWLRVQERDVRRNGSDSCCFFEALAVRWNHLSALLSGPRLCARIPLPVIVAKTERMPSRLSKPSEMVLEQPSGIDVLVVGAGLGGMVAAIELKRQGHKVSIIECKPKLEGLGTSHILQHNTPFWESLTFL